MSIDKATGSNTGQNITGGGKQVGRSKKSLQRTQSGKIVKQPQGQGANKENARNLQKSTTASIKKGGGDILKPIGNKPDKKTERTVEQKTDKVPLWKQREQFENTRQKQGRPAFAGPQTREMYTSIKEGGKEKRALEQATERYSKAQDEASHPKPGSDSKALSQDLKKASRELKYAGAENHNKEKGLEQEAALGAHRFEGSGKKKSPSAGIRVKDLAAIAANTSGKQTPEEIEIEENFLKSQYGEPQVDKNEPQVDKKASKRLSAFMGKITQAFHQVEKKLERLKGYHKVFGNEVYDSAGEKVDMYAKGKKVSYKGLHFIMGTPRVSPSGLQQTVKDLENWKAFAAQELGDDYAGKAVIEKAVNRAIDFMNSISTKSAVDYGQAKVEESASDAEDDAVMRELLHSEGESTVDYAQAKLEESASDAEDEGVMNALLSGKGADEPASLSPKKSVSIQEGPAKKKDLDVSYEERQARTRSQMREGSSLKSTAAKAEKSAEKSRKTNASATSLRMQELELKLDDHIGFLAKYAITQEQPGAVLYEKKFGNFTVGPEELEELKIGFDTPEAREEAQSLYTKRRDKAVESMISISKGRHHDQKPITREEAEKQVDERIKSQINIYKNMNPVKARDNHMAHIIPSKAAYMQIMASKVDQLKQETEEKIRFIVGFSIAEEQGDLIYFMESKNHKNMLFAPREKEFTNIEHRINHCRQLKEGLPASKVSLENWKEDAIYGLRQLSQGKDRNQPKISEEEARVRLDAAISDKQKVYADTKNIKVYADEVGKYIISGAEREDLVAEHMSKLEETLDTYVERCASHELKEYANEDEKNTVASALRKEMVTMSILLLGIEELRDGKQGIVDIKDPHVQAQMVGEAENRLRAIVDDKVSDGIAADLRASEPEA